MLIQNMNNQLKIFSSLLTNKAICKVISRTVFKEHTFSYGYKYRGGFDYHDLDKYPRHFHQNKEVELLDEIHAIRNQVIDTPSPFHVVRRIKSMTGLPWNQKVTLRRLNLHSSYIGECVIVPNTPQYNDLLLKVKHLLVLKPATFLDGRIPTEDDIGAIKVCSFTGQVKIDDKLRNLEKRVNIDKPYLFKGPHLRYKLGKIFGIHNKHPTLKRL